MTNLPANPRAHRTPAFRRTCLPAVAAVAVTGGLALSGCGTAQYVEPASSSTSSSSPSGSPSSTSSRISAVQASGTFDLLASATQTSVGANIALGSFTPPVTGTCQLNGTIRMSWGPQGGSGNLGWIVVTPGLQANGQGAGSLVYTGAHGPTQHDTTSRGGSAEADWPVSATVAVTRARPVALTFGLGGYGPDHTGVRYASALSYVCS